MAPKNFKSDLVKTIFQSINYLEDDSVYEHFVNLLEAMDSDFVEAEYTDEDGRPSSMETDTLLMKLEESLIVVVQEDDEVATVEDDDEDEESFDEVVAAADPDDEDEEDEFTDPNAETDEPK